MKKLLVGVSLAVIMASASAVPFFYNGVLMGTVCRSGLYYTVYPAYMAQPVGTQCPVRDNFGNIIGYGVVTNE